MLIKPFKTQRLILRPLEKEDAEALFLMDNNPEVMKYIGVPPVSDILQTYEVIGKIQDQYEKFGIGRFAVIEKHSCEFIGWCGLKFITENVNGHENFYELGYRFRPEFWGRGYAQESSKGFLKAGFEELNLTMIYAYAHSENMASNAVLKKLGFQQKGSFEEEDVLCFWYETSKGECKF